METHKVCNRKTVDNKKLMNIFLDVVANSIAQQSQNEHNRSTNDTTELGGELETIGNASLSNSIFDSLSNFMYNLLCKSAGEPILDLFKVMTVHFF